MKIRKRGKHALYRWYIRENENKEKEKTCNR